MRKDLHFDGCEEGVGMAAVGQVSEGDVFPFHLSSSEEVADKRRKAAGAQGEGEI